MKVAYEKLTTTINIDTDKISSIVVENEQFMYQMLMDLKSAVEGFDSGIVVSREEKPISISKSVALITDFVCFTLNQKSLITKIISELDTVSKNETFFHDSQKLLAYIEDYIFDLTLNFPCELVCEKLNIQNLLKGIGLAIVDDYGSLDERILAYMDLAREFEKKELFIFVNLRCFVPKDRLQLLIDTALTREHKILLIDNVECSRLNGERRTIIDKDLCII